VSALFSREFFALARDRLAPGGVFCQWAHIYNMAPADLRTVVGGFTDVFPGAALFLVNEGDVLLVGGRDGLPRPDAAAFAARLTPAVRADLEGVHVKTAGGVASLFALGPPDLAPWAAGAPRHTDDRPVLEFRAPRSLHADTSRANWEEIERAPRTAAPAEPFRSLGAAPTAEWLLERARMLEGARSFQLALAAFRRAAALEPGSLAALEGLARTALLGGQAAAAEEELRLLAAGRSPLAGRVALALLYHNQDRPAEALAALQEVARLDPRHRRALLLGAEVQAAAGNLGAAEGLARATLQLDPDDADAQALVAYARFAAGAVEEAVAHAERALARDGRCGRALGVIAIARARQGDHDGARRAFEKLVAADPDGWSHLNNFGVFELARGRPGAAARLFEQAVALNPGNVQGYRGLRAAARELGDARLLFRAEARLARLGQP
jgi:spermidine synthase